MAGTFVTDSPRRILRPELVSTRKNTVLISHGRPPWYSETGQSLGDAFVVGIAGGSASGKTHVAQQIVKQLGAIPSVVILSQDSFYKKHTPQEIELAFANQLDFDSPDSLDMQMFAQCLKDLKRNQQSNIPVYSFVEHQRLPETQYLYGVTIILAEGIMALQDPELRALYDLKIFVQCDSDLMLARRIRRDVNERGRDVNGIIDQYLRFVKPAYDNFVHNSSRYADVILPGEDNQVGINLIAEHVHRKLAERSATLRPKMIKAQAFLSPGLPPLLESSPETAAERLGIILLEQSADLKKIYATLRDQKRPGADNMVMLERLSSMVLERAGAELRSSNCSTAQNPNGNSADLCAVTIVQSPMMEQELTKRFGGIELGSLRIEAEPTVGEPLLLQNNVPVSVKARDKAVKTWVLLLDAQIGTAATAFMATRVLLDHGVREDHIVFVTLSVARGGGIAIMRKAFPKVRIITGTFDEDLKECWVMNKDDEAEVNESEDVQPR